MIKISGGKLMNEKTENATFKKNGVKLVLRALTVVAEKNATTLCKGFMYEPEVPKKLRSNHSI